MDETTWLTSTDPAAMLDLVTRQWVITKLRGKISDRKLRLFACACHQASGLNDGNWARMAEDGQEISEGANPAEYLARIWALEDGSAKLVHQATKAALLREIGGNPFRPISLTRPEDDIPPLIRQLHPQHWPKVRWLTPLVQGLATAAYLDRPGRTCGRCRGTKHIRVVDKRKHDENERRGIKVMIPPHKYEPCPDCHGTGKIEDGALANDRLAVLADCLDDAGADSQEILQHLRSPGQHVRGCWVLDLLLGKS